MPHALPSPLPPTSLQLAARLLEPHRLALFLRVARREPLQRLAAEHVQAVLSRQEDALLAVVLEGDRTGLCGSVERALHCCLLDVVLLKGVCHVLDVEGTVLLRGAGVFRCTTYSWPNWGLGIHKSLGVTAVTSK